MTDSPKPSSKSSRAAKPSRPRKTAKPAASRRTAGKSAGKAGSKPAPKPAAPRGPGARGLGWQTPLVFALLAPPLFMLIDMSFEQAMSGSLSIGRLASWISEDHFFALRAVYLAGILPAAFAGLIIARRDQRGGASPLFTLVLLVIFALPLAVIFARNLFLFAPPPFADAVLIGVRVVAAVVICGFVCYAGSRWLRNAAR